MKVTRKMLYGVLLVFGAIAMVGTVFAQTQTLGDVGNNITTSGEGVSNAVNTIALVVGAALTAIGLYGLYSSSNQNSQSRPKSAIAAVIIGGLLLAWQGVANINTATILGTGEDVAPEFLNTN